MRSRITGVVLATSSAIVASFVIPLLLLTRTLAEDRTMSAADQEARNVALLVATVPRQRELARLVAQLDGPSEPETTVVLPDGTTLGSPLLEAWQPALERARAGEAFNVEQAGGGAVVLPVVTDDGTAVVLTTVSPEQLRSGVRRAWLGIIGLGLVMLLAALVIASRLGRRISAPLHDVAEVAHRLREGELGARADVVGTSETEELARALNGLAERTGELLAAERAAVADLSHRLRTPVTALRLDVDAVHDPAVAERLSAHVTALQRTVDAIVKEARRPVLTDLAAASDVTATVRDRVDYWSALAEDQGRPVAVRLPAEPTRVPLAETDVADLIDVLIDNVFAHTPDGTAFTVGLDRVRDGVRLVVADDGPGLRPREERVGSTGLGLDIVRRTAAAAGGSVRLDPGPPGVRVEVTLPVVAS